MFQLKYKAALKKGCSSSLFHLLPETLDTAHAKEASELLSEVSQVLRSAHRGSVKNLLHLLRPDLSVGLWVKVKNKHSFEMCFSR